jgi:hypothetical protein
MHVHKQQRGIKHGVVEQNHAPTPWIFQMSGGEIALTLFATIAFTAPSDAASAIVVLVVREYNSNKICAICAPSRPQRLMPSFTVLNGRLQ